MAVSCAPSSFFERGLRGRATLGMPGPRLLIREPQALEQPRHAPRAVAHAVGPLGVIADVDEPPGAHPIAFWVGTTPRGPHAAGSVGWARPRPSKRLAVPRSIPRAAPSGAGRAAPRVLRRCSGSPHPAVPAAPSRPAGPLRLATCPPAHWQPPAGASMPGGPAQSAPSAGAHLAAGPGGWQARAWQASSTLPSAYARQPLGQIRTSVRRYESGSACRPYLRPCLKWSCLMHTL
jgi:hypothetical protein